MSFNDRFNPGQNRYRPHSRGRGHQKRFRGRGRGFNYRNSSPEFGHQYRELVTDFRQQTIDTIKPLKEKPKYETIVLELGPNSDQLSEDVLKKHFQTFGLIKKIWFNYTKSKAFICFFSHLSVDMCIESGSHVIINGLSLKAYPLEVPVPKELTSKNGEQSFHLKNLCQSINSDLKGRFPSMDTKPVFKQTLSTKQLLNLISIVKIDENKLMKDILSAKTVEQQLDVLCAELLLSDSELQKRNQLKDYLQEILCSDGFECRLHFIGSTVNSLGFRDSDIDIFIETFDGKQKSFDELMSSLKTVHKILKRTLKLFIPNPIPSSRCPIVKLIFNELFAVKNTGSEALVCDLSLSNAKAVRNSRLISLYCRLEPRFKQLCLLLRFWAKINGFVGSNHMSSYAFTHLVLFFCQTEGLLPSLDRIRELSPKTDPIFIDGWDCGFDEDFDDFTDNKRNMDSIIDLLEKFFKFYSEFDFSNLIICTKTGSTKQKTENHPKVDDNCAEEAEQLPKNTFKLTPIISIEDPFELTHNLTANLSFKTFDKFCDYLLSICRNFRQIFDNKSDETQSKASKKSKKTEENFWGISCLCREWDPTPNGYVFPEHFIGCANIDLILCPNTRQLPIDLMKSMANRLIDLTNIWLTDVYRIETLLLSKWDLISRQLSPFVEFYIKLRALDNHVIDLNTRLEFRQQLTEEELKSMSFTERETEITDRIHRKYNCDLKNSDIVPISCQFGLVMNCRPTFPTVELVLIELKPGSESSKLLMNFLKRLIIGATNDCRLLTCPHELITQ